MPCRASSGLRLGGGGPVCGAERFDAFFLPRWGVRLRPRSGVCAPVQSSARLRGGAARAQGGALERLVVVGWAVARVWLHAAHRVQGGGLRQRTGWPRVVLELAVRRGCRHQVRHHLREACACGHAGAPCHELSGGGQSGRCCEAALGGGRLRRHMQCRGTTASRAGALEGMLWGRPSAARSPGGGGGCEGGKGCGFKGLPPLLRARVCAFARLCVERRHRAWSSWVWLSRQVCGWSCRLGGWWGADGRRYGTVTRRPLHRRVFFPQVWDTLLSPGRPPLLCSILRSTHVSSDQVMGTSEPSPLWVVRMLPCPPSALFRGVESRERGREK